jgi:predicted nucleic acid-binding protein
MLISKQEIRHPHSALRVRGCKVLPRLYGCWMAVGTLCYLLRRARSRKEKYLRIYDIYSRLARRSRDIKCMVAVSVLSRTISVQQLTVS